MDRDSNPRIEPWFFIPPLICIVLLVVNNLSRDVSIFLWLNNLGRFGSDTFWIVITTFGDGLVLFILTLVFIRRKPDLAWSLILAWILVALWIKGIKACIVTYRPPSVLDPDSFRIVGPHFLYNSFPSGHATSIAAFAGSMCIFFRQWWLRTVALSLGLLIGFSRIAMGLHWTSDVLAGLTGGWLAALLGFYLSRRLRFGTSRAAQVCFAVITGALAVRMFLINHIEYPQAALLLQIIAASSVLLAAGDLLLGMKKPTLIK